MHKTGQPQIASVNAELTNMILYSSNGKTASQIGNLCMFLNIRIFSILPSYTEL
uniref:Uncharacterized protein n=1 Tax=Arundo donax TaxID=35708 RepID=A0A0A9GWX9_ARUDO